MYNIYIYVYLSLSLYIYICSIYIGYIGIMEKNMETIIFVGLGLVAWVEELGLRRGKGAGLRKVCRLQLRIRGLGLRAVEGVGLQCFHAPLNPISPKPKALNPKPCLYSIPGLMEEALRVKRFFLFLV